MFTIGNIKLKNPLILSPLAGISDLPFRLLNREFGCELAFVEMINARALGHKSKKTQSMLSTTPKDRPLGVQLLGCEPEFIRRAIGILQKYEFDILDFNAACPARKVTRRGEGASLLRDPKKLNELLKIVVKHSNVPVTAKIRAGWDADSMNARDVALYAQDAGICALFIHGRLKSQGYSGKVNYTAIKEVKDALNIPVIASGDIWDIEHAKKMFEETGCDALAIARGGLGNPWIFKEINTYLKTGIIPPRPTTREIIKVIYQHLKLMLDFYDEKTAAMLFRKFVGWYLKGHRKVKLIREQASIAKNCADIKRALDKYLNQ